VLIATYGNSVPAQKIPLLEKLDARVTERITEMILKRINAPLTSSCGRLFDAVSAILGICMETTYEAQAAIQLEMVADERETGFYRNSLLRLNSKGDLDWRNLISEVVEDLGERTPVSMISARFHRTLAEVFVHSAVSARVDLGINKVGLSGGVFQNCYFLGYLSSRLSQEGFEVLTHSEIPANDGGIAVGQIAVTAAMIS
jgi:hydrogenase maturation protein HypF